MNEFFEDEIESENQVIDEEYMDKLCEYIDIIDEVYVYFESDEEWANITSNKDNSEIKSSGHYSKITSTGDGAKITSSGGGAKITSSGGGAKINSTYDCAEINSSGEYGQITSTGYVAKINSSGDSANINSSGEYGQITSTGDGAKITSNGKSAHIISSGSNAEINITGEDSIVFVLGRNSIVKAKNGTRITMCEHIEAYSIFTLSVQIGNEEYKDYKGRTLNENEYYCLHHEEIYPVDICDGIKTIKISEKKKDGITIIKGQVLDEILKIFIVKDNNISAHGITLRVAIENFNFKKLTLEERSKILEERRKTLEKIIKEIKETGKVTKPQYRAITGACKFGVNEFCKKNNITVEEISLEELRKILIYDYGAKRFWALIDGRDTSDYMDDFDYEEDDDNEWTNFENISEDIDFSNYGDDDLPF